MKFKLLKSFSNFLPLLLPVLFFVVVYFYPNLIVFSGIIGIMILLLSLKNPFKNWKRIWAILSTLVTHFLLLWIYLFAVFGWDLMIYYPFVTITFALIYLVVFWRIGGWIQQIKRKFLIGGLVCLTLITLVYGLIVVDCFSDYGEKGYIVNNPVERCDKINVHLPVTDDEYEIGSYNGRTIDLYNQFTGFTSIAVLIALFFWPKRNMKD